MLVLMLELTSRGDCKLASLIPRKRTCGNFGGLPQHGLSGWQATEPQVKHHHVIALAPLGCISHTLAYLYLFIYLC